MATRYNGILSVVFFLVLSVALAEKMGDKACMRDATYELKFNYKWTSMYFDNIPRSAHFSPLIAFSHSRRYKTFTKYGEASEGFKIVAETGSTSTMESELKKGMEMGEVKDIQIDPTIPDADGTATVILKVNCSFPFVSAVSMVAPSPDWIVPLFREPTLRHKNMMKYRRNIEGSIVVWDAGTDSGMNLTSPDMPTDPKENIAELMSYPFDDKPIADFTLTKMKATEKLIMD